jgi:hypothetical protein
LSLATLSTSAWLAVDRRQQGKTYGRFLLADALYRAAQNEIPSSAVIADPKDYERESFPPFPDQPTKLFRPMADIWRLFDEP